MMNRDMNSNSVTRRVDGPTPNGGAYMIIAEYDENGVRQAEITEYDSNDEPIFRTYGTLAPKQS